MTHLAMTIAAVLLLCGSLVMRFIEQLRAFQQLGYYAGQYARRNSYYPDHVFTYIAAILLCIPELHPGFSLFFAALDLSFQILIAKGLKPKHPLVYTKRILRLIITIAMLTAAALTATCALLPVKFSAVAVAVIHAAAPLMIIAANFINRPIELSINKFYYRQAEECVKAAPFLKIAAITGSFGKTSIKNILGDMLKRDFNILVPPSSYNTKLGLTRLIREELLPTTQVMIAEMGAKKTGEILETVQMLPPDVALISTIAGQHLETFGSLDNIINEKAKVFEHLKKNGSAIINFDDPNIVKIQQRVDINKIYYSTKQITNKDIPSVYAEKIRVHSGGSDFTLVDARSGSQIRKIELHTGLLGEHNISNIVAAAAMALELGATLQSIARATAELVPVKNRLSTRIENGVTILEDAFNSNPAGARAALNVLSIMPANRRIIITPGMIELGSAEKEVHSEFGRQIAAVCDEVVLVTKKRTADIYSGIQSAGYDMANVRIVGGMREALGLIKTICNEGDVVLIENDLPDAYEEVV